MEISYICPVCGKNFSAHQRRTTCSKICLYKYQSRQESRQCSFCNKLVTRRKGSFSNYKNIFCDRKCQHKWESIHKAKLIELRNKDWCVEKYKTHSLKKIAESLHCGESVVYKWFKKHLIPLDRSQWISGSKHYNWKNNATELTHAIRTSQNYTKWREAVLKSNPLKCSLCGSTEKLEVDHIKQFKFILIDNNIKNLEDARKCEELWDVENGRVLCHKHNALDCRLNYWKPSQDEKRKEPKMWKIGPLKTKIERNGERQIAQSRAKQNA
jgi:hypothetical protein